MLDYDWSVANSLAMRTGKTTAICKAAKEIGATVVTGTSQEAKRLEKEYGIKALAVETAVRSRGKTGPILFDTFGVSRICELYENEIYRLKEQHKKEMKERNLV